MKNPLNRLKLETDIAVERPSLENNRDLAKMLGEIKGIGGRIDRMNATASITRWASRFALVLTGEVGTWIINEFKPINAGVDGIKSR